MADEQVVNSAPESTPGATQTEAANPPAVENTAPQTTEENKIPYSRFKEVIEERNKLEERLGKMEEALLQRQAVEKPSPSRKAKEKLVSAGVDEQVANLLADSMLELTKEYVEERVAPAEQQAHQLQTTMWVDKFAEKHKDFDQYGPVMYKAFQELPPDAQELVSTSPKGLELLYAHVKMQNLEAENKKNYDKGVEDAYKNKQMKSAVSSSATTPATPGEKLTREKIASMSLDEYRKMQKEVLSRLGELAAKQ